MGRFYNWVLTMNLKKTAPEEEGFEWIYIYKYGIPILPKQKLIYCIYTLEMKENLHYHFYCEFTEKVSMKWIKENFDCKYLRCEPRKGTQKQAINYIKKINDFKETISTKVYEDIPWLEIGDKKHQGNRSDLDSMVDMIEEGYLPGDILQTFRGNALRHMSHIYKATMSVYGLTSEDRVLNMYTRQERMDLINNRKPKCLEVEGNTVCTSTSSLLC